MDSFRITNIPGPHSGQPVLTAGDPLARARAAMILVHGRGAGAEDMLGLAKEIALPGYAYLAPQAAGSTWYPQRFMAPLAVNEPWLSSALAFVGALLEQTAGAGIGAERTVLLGFSQGACLALEFAARQPRRYGGVVGLAGGLIGPDTDPAGTASSAAGALADGGLAGTPIFLGCSDVDPHIPAYRVRAAEATLRDLGGNVTMHLYPGLGHTVNRDELEAVRTLAAAVSQQASSDGGH